MQKKSFSIQKKNNEAKEYIKEYGKSAFWRDVLFATEKDNKPKKLSSNDFLSWLIIGILMIVGCIFLAGFFIFVGI